MQIPFEQTITGAYRFGFTRILTVLGIVWLPLLVMCAILGGFAYLMAPSVVALFQHFPLQDAGPPDKAQVGAIVRMAWTIEAVVIPVTIVFFTMMRVGVMRAALGLNEGPVFVFFTLGGQFWRLLGAYVLLVLAMYALGIALFAGGFALWYVLHTAASGLAGLLVVLYGIAAGCFVIYAAVRTWFFLAAVVVAEGLLGLGRSWQLGGGNFWRIVGIVLIVYLPVGFAVGIVNSSIMQMTILPEIMQHAGQAQTPAESRAAVQAIFGAFLRYLPYLGALQLIQMVLTLGIDVGAVATAYRAATGKGEA